VRNYQARNNMRAMQKGDLGFFYHTGEEKRIVGIVKVVKEAHPESTDDTGLWECVDVAAVMDLPKPVTLAEIKANAKLKNMVLVRVSRLSVQPVSPQEWSIICGLAGLAKPPKA
jgi:predicted RNA-binding protein with PUA-like domain